MPKSKRDRKIALSKTQKKIGLETKQVSRKYLSYYMPGITKKFPIQLAEFFGKKVSKFK